MPKPQSKEDLIEASQKNYQSLVQLLDSLTDEQLITEFKDHRVNRNVRDVITHLHHWHIMFLNWYEVGMKGEKPDMPAKDYTWQTLPDLNLKIWETYQKTGVSEARLLLEESFLSVQKVIGSHDNHELFEKKKYHWTGSTSLGAYLISNTSSHYAWAVKRIKQSLK